jgi:hypothetical protein
MSAQSNKISSHQLQDKLKQVVSDVVETGEREKNLYIIKTSKGKIKVWSDLEPKEFYQSLKLKRK